MLQHLQWLAGEVLKALNDCKVRLLTWARGSSRRLMERIRWLQSVLDDLRAAIGSCLSGRERRRARPRSPTAMLAPILEGEEAFEFDDAQEATGSAAEVAVLSEGGGNEEGVVAVAAFADAVIAAELVAEARIGSAQSAPALNDAITEPTAAAAAAVAADPVVVTATAAADWQLKVTDAVVDPSYWAAVLEQLVERVEVRASAQAEAAAVAAAAAEAAAAERKFKLTAAAAAAASTVSGAAAAAAANVYGAVTFNWAGWAALTARDAVAGVVFGGGGGGGGGSDGSSGGSGGGKAVESFGDALADGADKAQGARGRAASMVPAAARCGKGVCTPRLSRSPSPYR